MLSGGPDHRHGVWQTQCPPPRGRWGPHFSIVTTADTYVSVLPEAAHGAAQATADMVIEAARSAPGSRSSGTGVPHIPAAVTASGHCQM